MNRVRRAPVAQIVNLLYRRLVIGVRGGEPTLLRPRVESTDTLFPKPKELLARSCFRIRAPRSRNIAPLSLQLRGSLERAAPTP